MDYSDKILYQIDYINSLLNDYNEKPILENENFTLDEMSWAEYLKVTFRKTNSISFDLICSSTDFQLNVDRANEVVDLMLDDFDKNKETIRAFFNCLFVCKVKIEYCGSNYTKIFFYNDKGSCIKTLKYVTGLYLKFGCRIKEYPPIFTLQITPQNQKNRVEYLDRT